MVGVYLQKNKRTGSVACRPMYARFYKKAPADRHFGGERDLPTEKAQLPKTKQQINPFTFGNAQNKRNPKGDTYKTSLLPEAETVMKGYGAVLSISNFPISHISPNCHLYSHFTAK